VDSRNNHNPQPDSPNYIAPDCIVIGCPNLSALSSVASDNYWTFTTYYCANCYEDLLNGKPLEIELSRIIAERRPSPEISPSL
jgi:hypothetical protein